jgi:hypothetical protein
MTEENWTFLSDGRNRAVYSHGRYVVKVPLNEAGYHDNYREANISSKMKRRPNQDGIVFARCRLLPNGWLVMERVDTRYLRRDERPDWADWIDCAQVGIARDGVIVAYDFVCC